jgi:hypothetical protein
LYLHYRCIHWGHPNLNGGHPGLLKDFPRGILVIEMLSTSVWPKKVKDEIAKDVKQLSNVEKAPYMVPLDLGGSFSLLKTASPSMTNGQERMTSLGTPHFCQSNRRPPKPVWRRDIRKDSVEGIQRPPLYKPCTWGRSPCIATKCLPRGPSLVWAIWECRPSEVGSYAKFWP